MQSDVRPRVYVKLKDACMSYPKSRISITCHTPLSHEKNTSTPKLFVAIYDASFINTSESDPTVHCVRDLKPATVF